MEYQKCLVELDEILSQLRKEDLEKIPYEIRNVIKEKKDKQYRWDYDKTRSLSEQNINRKTIAMLCYLNLEYLLNEEQKVLVEKIHKSNEKKAEEEKEKKYNPKDLFKNKIIDKQEHNIILMQTENDKWYKKIVLFLKEIAKK